MVGLRIERQLRAAWAGLRAASDHLAAADNRVQADIRADVEAAWRTEACARHLDPCPAAQIGVHRAGARRQTAILDLDAGGALCAAAAGVLHAAQQREHDPPRAMDRLASAARRHACWRIAALHGIHADHLGTAEPKRRSQALRYALHRDHSLKAGAAAPAGHDLFHDVTLFAGTFLRLHTSAAGAVRGLSSSFHTFPPPPETGAGSSYAWPGAGVSATFKNAGKRQNGPGTAPDPLRLFSFTDCRPQSRSIQACPDRRAPPPRR